MNYTQSITRRHRTAFVLAIDQSGSMVEELKFRGQRISKAAAVAEVANSLLSELLLRATREGEVRDYYDIAVIGYSGEGVRSLLSADEAFVPVPALENATRNTRRVCVERRLPDGQPAFNEVTLREWIAPAASGQTPMYEALLYVHDLVEGWCRRPEHSGSFPPMVFNITDGEASDSDEEELAQIAARIRSLGTDDGHALLVNIHLASGDAAPGRIFLTEEEAAYDNRYARLLYDISSPMPPLFEEAIRTLRDDRARGPFRGMCYNASITELLSILNVGSISVNLQ
ncbi:VWA domain-containing protein [Alistipes sp.]|uniref:VWA domain-containing protein n=1 Tax=Alistipes sp. TaxID=1872444 RepID=UPI003A856D74